MGKLTIKKGDTRPWQSELTSDGDDDLSGASSVAVYMRKQGATSNKIDGTSGTVSAATTTKITVKYSPTAANVDTAGTYDLEWVVTFSDATTATFPSSGFDTIVIHDDLS